MYCGRWVLKRTALVPIVREEADLLPHRDTHNFKILFFFMEPVRFFDMFLHGGMGEFYFCIRWGKEHIRTGLRSLHTPPRPS